MMCAQKTLYYSIEKHLNFGLDCSIDSIIAIVTRNESMTTMHVRKLGSENLARETKFGQQGSQNPICKAKWFQMVESKTNMLFFTSSVNFLLISH